MKLRTIRIINGQRNKHRAWVSITFGRGHSGPSIDWNALQSRMSMRALVEPDPEEYVQEPVQIEYRIARVKDGEIVATFLQRQDAAELIKKHARQKKAKLMLLPGEGVEPFTEEELQG